MRGGRGEGSDGRPAGVRGWLWDGRVKRGLSFWERIAWREVVSWVAERIERWESRRVVAVCCVETVVQRSARWV